MSQDNRLPTASIIIPVRNGAASIEACLNGALTQKYDGEIQVVVADGASTDGTRSILERWANRDSRVLVVDSPSGLTPAGLNAALEAAVGEVVVRCDAHSVLPPGYLRRAVQILDETGADVVGGIQRAVGTTFVERAIALAMSSRMGVGDSKFHYGGSPGPTDTVYLGVFKGDVFERVGTYDETLPRNQDYELNWRIRQSGGTVYFHPDLEVQYRPRGSLGSLWRQYYGYGHWKRVVLARHPRSLRWRQLAPPLLVLGLTGSLVLVLTPWRSWAWILPASYALAVLAASLGSWVAKHDRAAGLLPLVYPTMHVAWGLGFLLP